jgi:hypothetical protein
MQINNQRTSQSIGLNGILYDIQLPRIGAVAVASGESTALVRRLPAHIRRTPRFAGRRFEKDAQRASGRSPISVAYRRLDISQ